MLRTRIFWKAFAGHVVLGLGTVAVVAWLILGAASGHLTRQIHEDLENRAHLLAELSGALPEPVLRDRIAALGDLTGTRFTVIASDGSVVADSHHSPVDMENHGARPEVLQAKTHGLGSSERKSSTSGRRMLYMAVRLPGAAGYARAALHLDRVEQQYSDLRRRFFAGAGIAFLFALVLGFLAARRVAAPILDLTRAAEAFADGKPASVGWDSPDEIGELARRFNDMTRLSTERLDTTTQDRNKLAAILAGMVEGVIAVDEEERILHINHAAVRMLGAASGTEGRHVWELPRSRDIADLVSRCLAEDMVMTGESRFTGPSGAVHLELFASPLRDGRGQLRGSAIVLHDITRLRRLEAVRRDFVANASHELKTPITAIIGLVETLLEDADMPPETRTRFLGKIRDQSGRLSALVQDLITLSRVEDSDRVVQRPADLGRAVRDAVGALVPAARAKGVDLEHEVPRDPVPMVALPEDLRDVVENLVGNALKYTGSGGRVVVSLHREGRDGILEVSDTGIGIPPAHHERIFERFYRVDQARSRDLGGTGLGLAIVRNVAQSLGGSVKVQSEPGSGSTFRFRAPLAPSEPPAPSG